MEDNIIHIDTEKFSEEENQWRGDTFEEIVTENFPEFRKCVKTSDSEGFWAAWDRSRVSYPIVAAPLLLQPLLVAPCKYHLTVCSLNCPKYLLCSACRLLWCHGTRAHRNPHSAHALAAGRCWPLPWDSTCLMGVGNDASMCLSFICWLDYSEVQCSDIINWHRPLSCNWRTFSCTNIHSFFIMPPCPSPILYSCFLGSRDELSYWTNVRSSLRPDVLLYGKNKPLLI